MLYQKAENMFRVILCVAYRISVTCPEALKLTNVTEN